MLYVVISLCWGSWQLCACALLELREFQLTERLTTTDAL